MMRPLPYGARRMASAKRVQRACELGHDRCVSRREGALAATCWASMSISPNRSIVGGCAWLARRGLHRAIDRLAFRANGSAEGVLHPGLRRLRTGDGRGGEFRVLPCVCVVVPDLIDAHTGHVGKLDGTVQKNEI